MKGALNEKHRSKKEEKKKTSPKATTTTTTKPTTKKNIVLPAPAAAVSRTTRRSSSGGAATNVKTPPATSTPSIHNAKDPGSKRKKACKVNAEKDADPVLCSYDENLLNKMWDEGLGCREHINEYDDFPQHSTGINNTVIYNIYLFLLLVTIIPIKCCI